MIIKVESCFVKTFTKDKVMCYFFNIGELREFTKEPFFRNMHLFKGMNLQFTFNIKQCQQTISCTENKISKFKQLWNYYIKRKF